MLLVTSLEMGSNSESTLFFMLMYYMCKYFATTILYAIYAMTLYNFHL